MKKRDIPKNQGPIDPYKTPRNDRGNAELFVDYWENSILAIENSSGMWYGYIGERWKLQEHGQLTEEFHEAVTYRWDAAADQLDQKAKQAELQAEGQSTLELADEAAWIADMLAKGRNAVRRFADQCSDTRSITPALRQAHNIAQRRGQSVTEDEFDSYAEAFGIPSGILDLSGDAPVVHPRSPEWKITKEFACDFVPGATHPDWDSYLDTFIPDLELRAFVQKAMGYAALRRRNPEHLAVFLVGPPRTGKSVMNESTLNILGPDHGCTVTPSLFTEQTEQGSNVELVNAMFANIISLSEGSTLAGVDAPTLKRFTGLEKLAARLNFSNTMVNRVPDFTPVFATNTMPKIRGADAALRRRLLVVPFDIQAEHVAEKAEIAKNSEMWPAVLAWLVEGYQRYKREGLHRENWPAAVVKATNEAATEIDPLTSWWAERVDQTNDPKDRVRVDEVRADYVAWADQHNVKPNLTGLAQFIAKSKGHKQEPRRVQKVSVRFYFGFHLRPEEPPEA